MENKPVHEYCKGQRYKPEQLNSKDTLTLSLSSLLSLSSQWPLYVFRFSKPYNMPAELVALCVFRLPFTHIISTASLSYYSLLPLSSQWPMHVFRFSKPYNMPAELVALCVFRLPFTHVISTASLSSYSLLPLSSQWTLYVFRFSINIQYAS